MAKKDVLPVEKSLKLEVPIKKYVVLFLCNANQERSPMGARLMQMKMPEDLNDYFTAVSDGIMVSAREDYTLENYLRRHPFLRNRNSRQVTDL